MHSDQKIKFYENESGGRFYIGDYAEMTFAKTSANTINIDYTRVNNKHRGEGLAQQLYKVMVEHARQQNLKIIPACSFVKTMFKKNPKDQHLLATSPTE